MDTVKSNAPATVPAVQEIAVIQASPAISQAPQVYAAINAVQREIAVTGISKNNATTGGAKFKFRGIDDVYNALSPLIAKHGLIVAPRYTDRALIERKSSNGNSLFYITIIGHFDFISVKDGSKHTVTTFGEAMDSGDKGTNKAMAIAHKYALLQVFAIPTEGDNDPDNYTHHPQPYQGNNNQQQNNNQTHVGQAQRINTPPLRMAVLQFATPETIANKPKTSDGRRLFSPEQFRDLELSLLNNQFKASQFLDPNKYYFSDEQLATLNNFNNSQLMIGQ